MDFFSSFFKKLKSGSSFWRYLIVGVGTSGLDLSLFTLFSVVFEINEVISNIFSTIITVCVSYLINRSFVFNSQKTGWASFFSFAGVTLITGLIIQSFIIWTLISFASYALPSLSPAIVNPAVKICAMGVGAICNYLGYRFIFTEK
ncbi:GtrA family protein [Actinomycetaceae bacterium TAE3-ERU4]|nr:GtrA family protein [Actinomycetaceae bacterium TAE3-ERU4]